MTVKEALLEVDNNYIEDKLPNDSVDFYIDGWDEGFPTFVLPDDEMNFNDYFCEKFKTILNWEVSSIDYPDPEGNSEWTIINIVGPESGDEEDYEKLAHLLKNFLLTCAGYGPWTEYKKLFDEEEYAHGPVFDEYDIALRYNILIDTDLLGANYKVFKELYDKNVSKEEFMKKYNEITNNEE